MDLGLLGASYNLQALGPKFTFIEQSSLRQSETVFREWPLSKVFALLIIFFLLRFSTPFFSLSFFFAYLVFFPLFLENLVASRFPQVENIT